MSNARCTDLVAHVAVVAVNIVGAIDAIRMLVWRVLCVLSISLFPETKNIRRSTNIIPILTTVVLDNFGNLRKWQLHSSLDRRRGNKICYASIRSTLNITWLLDNLVPGLEERTLGTRLLQTLLRSCAEQNLFQIKLFSDIPQFGEDSVTWHV